VKTGEDTFMGRAFSRLLAVTGFALIALGLWTIFHFQKINLPEPIPPVGYVIQRHPAADAGDKLAIAGALCLLAAAVNNRGTPPTPAEFWKRDDAGE
jgi:hypothetical protein